MTREEAIEYINEWLKDEYALSSKDIMVLTMAIEALSNANQYVESDDIISRSRAIEAFADMRDGYPVVHGNMLSDDRVDSSKREVTE